MKTDRIGFSRWKEEDLNLASLLWGEGDVTRFICAAGKFTLEDIRNRLNAEIQNGKTYGVQYWPIFELETEELIGCCGVRPYGSKTNAFEIGFHLRKKYWGKGYACEAAKAVIGYSFTELHAPALFAGHHPQNAASRKTSYEPGV
jgi:RimJ/RimL family protein N-acetyltransferase